MLQSDDVTCSGVKHLTSRVMTPEPHEREQSDHRVMNHSLTQASRAHACVTSGRFASAQFASSTMTTARPTCLTQMTSRDLTPLPHVTEHCKENEAMTKTIVCQTTTKKSHLFPGSGKPMAAAWNVVVAGARLVWFRQTATTSGSADDGTRVDTCTACVGALERE